MRNTFISNLVRHANERDNIVLIVGDLGFSVVEPFAEKFPDRFFNVGVAEQNMTGIAAGMASEGYHVFTYSIANFPTFRCAEQIRNDIDYHNLPVTIVSIGGGLAYGNLGYSHHALQDFALIRSMPNMLIAAPGDQNETSSCLEYIINNPQPSYLRINKSGEQNIHKSAPLLEPGVMVKVRPNNDAKKLILSTGSVLPTALEIWESNKDTRNYCTVGSLPLWGETYRKTLYENIKSFDKIYSIEEHLLSGGFGSWILESDLPCQPFFLDNNTCGAVGTQNYLRNKYGLDPSLIANVIGKNI